MLKDQDRIFKNLYNDMGSDVVSAQRRGDWYLSNHLFFGMKLNLNPNHYINFEKFYLDP